MKLWLILASLALGTLSILTACGGGGGSSSPPPTVVDPPPPPPPTGLLIPAADNTAFVDAFRRSLPTAITSAEPDGEGAPLIAQPPSLQLDGQGFSTTYRLKDAVDEHDYVKYDGSALYIAPSRSQVCCFITEPFTDDAALLPPPPPLDDGPRRIRILSTDTDSATATEIGAVELDSGITIEGLYINGDSLTALSSSAWWGQHGDAFTSIGAWESQQLGLTIYDVADPGSPDTTFSIELDGALVASRRIDDSVFIISRHLPEIEDLNYAASTDEERAANQATLDNLDAGQLLPRIAINGERDETALTVEDCLITDDDNELAPDEPGYPVITTILRVDISSGALTDSLCYAEPADGIYVSPGAIYLAQTVYDDPRAVDSIVHRVDLDDGLTYRGSGRVAGSLIGRGQADFRMSENNGVLRLVTTRWLADEEDAFDHRLFTLELAADAPELQLLAQLPAEGSEEVIGKPNEDLFGVRFIGDRAYLVTFERIDPLYVIGLSDPANPQILGELEVTGFSDLLHPVSDALLLGLGQDAEGFIKLELFDVDDPTRPRSQGLVTLATEATWSYTNARYDRRSFTYLAQEDAPDRITVPMSVGLETDDGFFSEERLYMLEIENGEDPASAQLMERGFLTATPTTFADTRPRGIIDGDALFFLLGEEVWSGFWGRGETTFGPF